MPDSRPHLWVFAGPNGAGKSTLVMEHLRYRLPLINPDVIAAALIELEPNAQAVLEAGKRLFANVLRSSPRVRRSRAKPP